MLENLLLENVLSFLILQERCWGPKFDKKAHSMKSKNKKHGSWQKKAQKKEKERKKKYKKKRTQTWATSRIPILQEADPLRGSLRDPEKDVDGLEDPKKDVGDLEDRTNHL